MNPGIVLGLAVMVVSEAATLAHIEPFWSWNTPICWTGFIVFADSMVRRARGDSWLSSSGREFIFLASVSIPLWLVFEFYNQFIHNWFYVGLSENLALRYFGYAWAFATILPALFEGAELVSVWRATVGRTISSRYVVIGAPATRSRRVPADCSLAVEGAMGSGGGAIALKPDSTRGSGVATFSILIGAAMLISPFLVSTTTAQYLAAPVWLGFIFLLDPINDRLGFQALLGDWRRRRVDRLVNLLMSGLMCGVLWEFWNFWSRSKWHYTVPILPNIRIFEMPLPGYFGFPPFALECFAMYAFVRGVIGSVAGLKSSTMAPRQIGL